MAAATANAPAGVPRIRLLRRVAAFVLLAIGAALIGAGLHTLDFDARRGALVVALALVGCGCAAGALLAPTRALSAPLRVLAVAMGLMALTAVGLIWYVLRSHPGLMQIGPEFAPIDPRLTSRVLPLLAAAIVHATFGVLVLPRQPRSAGAE